MNHINRFSLTLESLAKLASETNTIHSAPLSALPTLNSVLAEFAPLPRAALFLGLAADGLPILLNLLDPLPGPIMIVGSENSGKTNFLQMISCAVNRIHSSNDVSYSIIANEPSDWKAVELSDNCEKILSVRDQNVGNQLRSLVEWAHLNKNEQPIHLLIIDQLASLLESPEFQQDLRWLLLRGPSRRVWPIVTINSSIAASDFFQPWLGAFRTRLFGYISSNDETTYLTGSSQNSFPHLVAGFQFAMREGSQWLPFWIPALD